MKSKLSFSITSKKLIAILSALIINILVFSFWLISKNYILSTEANLCYEAASISSFASKQLEIDIAEHSTGQHVISAQITELEKSLAALTKVRENSSTISNIISVEEIKSIQSIITRLKQHSSSPSASDIASVKIETATLTNTLNSIKNNILDYINNLSTSFEKLLIILFFTNAIPIVLLGLLVRKKYIKPLDLLSEVVEKKDKIVNFKLDENKDFVKVTDALNFYNRNLKTAMEFVKKVGEGHLDADFNMLSEQERNEGLPAALIDMREKMKMVAKEEGQRKWSTEGLATFVEILRTNNDNLKELTFNIISSLVKYVKANQGGLFLLHNDNQSEKYLDLVASYAFEKRKFLQKRIECGEGLVGQAVLEADTVYVTDIPQDYVQITSGLGGANPSSILIVPLKVNEEVHGVVELASFSKFQKYEIEFIEKLAESIASTISAVKVNERTKKLLEESQQLTEELRAQEEEVRQNMEELSATQEDMQRVNMEMQTQNEIINRVAIVSKTDLRGNIIYVNDEFLKWSKYTREEVIGKNHRILKSGDQPDSLFEELWKTISSGKVFRGEIKNKAKDGSIYWVDAIIAPVLDTNGKPKEYIAQRFVINEAKQKEEQLKLNMDMLQATQNEVAKKNHEINLFAEAVGEALIMGEYTSDGTIIKVNDNYEKSTGYSSSELVGNNIMMIIDEKDKQQYKKIWSEIIKGRPYKGEAKRIAKNGEQRWYLATYNPVVGKDGDVEKVYYLGQDITEMKLLEMEAKNQTEELRAQEEELRQNMEELSATQEEMQRIFQEMEAQNEIINSVAIVSKTDLRGNITYVNDEFLKWSKYSKEELIGKNHRILKSGDQPDSIFEELWKTISSGKIFRGEIKNKAKDGTFYWVDAIIAPVLDSDGKPKEYIAQRFVINEAKEKEEKLKEALDALARKSKKIKI